jgi:UDP-N-acetyl-2-amino-2-deoxyglucuronate dehydrogenase
MKCYAIIGVAGYVAPRHLQAIRDTGGNLVAAMDISDSVGVLDRYFPDAAFFTNALEFEDYLKNLTVSGDGIDYLVVCTPNHFHVEHCSMGLNIGADVICEKPLALYPQDLKGLKELENRTGRRIFTILQLRLHPELLKLKQDLELQPEGFHEVTLQYITPRGKWYQNSWKGDVSKSGGLATNIGIHLFDLLIWLFGEVKSFEKVSHSNMKISGTLELKRAHVKWMLSIDKNDLKEHQLSSRALTVDGLSVVFDQGFADLHTLCYQQIHHGKGIMADVCLPSIQLASQLR